MDRACNFNKKTFSRQYNGRGSAYGAEQWICFTRLAPQTGSNTQAGNMWTADHLSIHAPARWANRIPKHFFLIKKEIIIPPYPLPFLRKKSEEKYRLLTESISDVIWTMDLELKFQYVSPAIEKLQGFNV
jgi:PAS domain-containing protein